MSDIKSALIGPGSQPSDPDVGDFEYMEMPKGMTTFSAPNMPEPEDIQGLDAGMEALEHVQRALADYDVRDQSRVVDLGHLDKSNLAFVNQVLGEGEVSIVSGSEVQAQESVLAGVWRVHKVDGDGRLVSDAIEIADYPASVSSIVFRDVNDTVADIDDTLPDGVFNAPPLLVEIGDKVSSFRPGMQAHAINLTLLPQTEQDIEYLHLKLGKGTTTILSRGYGNCRVTSTGTKNVWWVQYFNSQDTLILNSIEIISVPEVVCAAEEDISDSADRLNEILEVYR